MNVSHKGQRAERSRDTRLAPKPAVCKEQPEFPACSLVENCSTLEKDEAGLGIRHSMCFLHDLCKLCIDVCGPVSSLKSENNERSHSTYYMMLL